MRKFGEIPFRFMDTGDGGGGDPGAGAGADPGSIASGGQPSPSEPQAIDLSDDSFIRVKGIDKPVKYGEHVKGLQTQYTRAAQEAAKLKAEVARHKEEAERYRQEVQRAAQVQNGGQQGGQQDIYKMLGELPYLTGPDAAYVVQSIAGQIQQRDQVLLGALNQLKQMQQIVGTLHGNYTNQSFDAKINKFLTDGGYDPAELGDFAKELYLAYEGDDLDQEFPRILAERIGQMEKFFGKKIAAARQQTRQNPFIPGKGANVGPNKPLEIKPDAKSSEIADLLFPMFAQSET